MKFVCERDSVPPVYPTGFSYTANDTADATRNFTQWAVDLDVNGGFTAGTCGVQGATVTGDSFLRVFNPQGVQVAFNDDACVPGSLGSNVAFAATARGTYTIRAGCYDDTSCGGMVKIRTTCQFGITCIE
jgi:hypothetical protein